MVKKGGLFGFFKKNSSSITQKSRGVYYVSCGSYGLGGASNTIHSDFADFAGNAFMQNVVAHRAISLIAKNAATVKLIVYSLLSDGTMVEQKSHNVVRLIRNPYGCMSGVQFLESAISHFLLSGNCYIYAIRSGTRIKELQLLRPDRVEIILDNSGIKTYRYSIDGYVEDIKTDPETGTNNVLHIKTFHPLNDLYGLSALQSAKAAIEQHNECLKWNRSLLKNGARPTGAIVVGSDGQFGGSLTDQQFENLRSQVTESWSGGDNAGKVLILEGGLKWQDIGMSPRDMDYAGTKDSAARDIATALGMPPQLLGIKGDNTYNNMSEARIGLWEDSVLPLLQVFCDSMSAWISLLTEEDIIIAPDLDTISALSEKRQTTWNSLSQSNFITDEEKRGMLGFDENNKTAVNNIDGSVDQK